MGGQDVGIFIPLAPLIPGLAVIAEVTHHDKKGSLRMMLIRRSGRAAPDAVIGRLGITKDEDLVGIELFRRRMEGKPAAFPISRGDFIFICRIGLKALHIGTIRIGRHPVCIIHRRPLRAGNEGPLCIRIPLLAVYDGVGTGAAVVLPGYRLCRSRITGNDLYQIRNGNGCTAGQARQTGGHEGQERACPFFYIYHGVVILSVAKVILARKQKVASFIPVACLLMI